MSEEYRLTTWLTQLRLRAETPEFQSSVRAQASMLVGLREMWPDIEPHHQRGILEWLPGRVRRCREEGHPEKMLIRILTLRDPEDIERALLVGTQDLPKWQGEAGENIYPKSGWLGRYLAYGRHNKIPAAFHFWSGVLAIGAVCRRSFYLDWAMDHYYLNQYIILTGKKAAGKSAAMAIARDIVIRVNHQVTAAGDPLKLGYDIAPYKVNILPEDVTQEGIISELDTVQKRWNIEENHPGLGKVSQSILVDATAVMFLDELTNFLGKENFAVGKRVPFLTTIYSKRDHIKGTKGQGREELHNLAISILGCSAPEWLRNSITQDVFGGGFMDRVLWVYRPPTQRCYPKPGYLDPVWAEQLAEDLRPLTQVRPGTRTRLFLTPEADAWMDAWYRTAHSKGHLDFHDSTLRSLERRQILGLKLGMILAISEGTCPEIPQPQVELAMKILDYEDQFLDEFLAKVRERDDAEYYRWIKTFIQQKGGWASRSDITQRFKDTIGRRRVLDTYRDTLVESGELITRRKPKTGAMWYGFPESIPPWEKN